MALQGQKNIFLQVLYLLATIPNIEQSLDKIL